MEQTKWSQQCVTEVWFLPSVWLAQALSSAGGRMRPRMRRPSAKRPSVLTGPPPPPAIPLKWPRSTLPTARLSRPTDFVAGHDALVKMYASFMKPGDKEVDTSTSARMIGDVALCTGGFSFTPASATSGDKGFWTKVVGKVGGEWKILNLTYATAAPQ
jgi:hypothetical protein